ncbi:triK protein, partial [Enterobacter sp. CM29]|nr:triK protein [Enterobacter sp. CM29]
MQYNEVDYLRWVYDNAYPNLTYIFVLVLAMLIQFTFSGHVTKKDNLGVWEHIVMHFRQKILVAYLLLFVLFNVYTGIVAAKQLGRDGAIEFLKTIYSNLSDEIFTVSSILSILTVFVIPYFFHAIHKRYLSPRISSFRRKFRVSQTGDSLSDIRIEKDRFLSKNFDNREYYKDDFMFMGLDENGEAIYLPDEEFKSKNLKILGATQTGKGVIQQVCIDQAIKKGWGIWFFDQKPDDFIYSIMVDSCKKWKRSPPVVLDLTGESNGTYSPFENGLKRERLNRFNKVFGLTSKGSDSDYYKAINRQIITFLSDYWDGTLQHLDKLLRGNDKAVPSEKRQWIMDNTVNIQSKLDEWKLLPHLFGAKGTGL